MVFLPGIPSTRRFAKAQNLQGNYVRSVNTGSFHPRVVSQTASPEAVAMAARGRGVEGQGQEWGGELSFAQEKDMK